MMKEFLNIGGQYWHALQFVRFFWARSCRHPHFRRRKKKKDGKMGGMNECEREEITQGQTSENFTSYKISLLLTVRELPLAHI